MTPVKGRFDGVMDRRRFLAMTAGLGSGGALGLLPAFPGAEQRRRKMRCEPFQIRIPESALSDLAARLGRTRFADAVKDAGWRYGADRGFMEALADHWRARFDWRAQEARLNAFPQFVADVDGQRIHFIHVRGKGPDPLPLVITHGWPSSFAEFSKIIPLLADPAAHGGRAEDSFDVIAPSLPGYGFSARPAAPGMSSPAVTALWAKLMTDTLGYERFAAHGGDIGGGIANRLARYFPDRLIAIHTMVAPTVDLAAAGDASEAERAFVALGDAWELEEGAYGHQQRTRPQTLAFALNDSPVGLAAWIAEKWRAWSDCGGDVLSRFSMDELLTTISIYWFTQTIGSSMRIYFETAHAQEPKPERRIDVPARLFLTTEPVDRCPREYAARSFANLYYGLAPKGGHFLAAEEPELLAEDIRAWFRGFRKSRA
jgi:microsomal epoxide hydrolase